MSGDRRPGRACAGLLGDGRVPSAWSRAFSKSHGNACFKTGALCCVSTLSQCSHFLRSSWGLVPVLGGVRPAPLFGPPPCTHRRRPASARRRCAASEDPGNSYQFARLFLIPPCGTEELPVEVITVAVSSQRARASWKGPRSPCASARAKERLHLGLQPSSQTSTAASSGLHTGLCLGNGAAALKH